MPRLRNILHQMLFLDHPRRRDGVYGVIHRRRRAFEELVDTTLQQLDATDVDNAVRITEGILEGWRNGRPEAVREGGLSWSGREDRVAFPPDAPHSAVLDVGEPGCEVPNLLRVRIDGRAATSAERRPEDGERHSGTYAVLRLPPLGRRGPDTSALPGVRAILSSCSPETAREVTDELDGLRRGPSARPLRPGGLPRLLRLMDQVIAEEITNRLEDHESGLRGFRDLRLILVPIAEALAELEDTRWKTHLEPARTLSWRDLVPESGVLLVQGPNTPLLESLANPDMPRFDLAFLDPPYNTGSSLRRYADSRSSREWLTLIHGTLRAVHRCMHDTGLVFTCIDDNEVSRMRLLLEEPGFHELSCVVVKMSELSGPKMRHADRIFSRLKEYLLVHGRTPQAALSVPRRRKDRETLLRYCKYYTKYILNPDAPPESWNLEVASAAMARDGIDPSDGEARLDWQVKNAHRLIYRTNNRTIAEWRTGHPDAPEIATITGADGRGRIAWGHRELLRLSDFLDAPIGDLWLDISTINLHRELMGLPAYRGGQKPLALVQRVLESTPGDAITLIDPWAGSGTTGHAALQRLANGRPTRAVLAESSPEAFALAHERLRRVAEHVGLPAETVRTLDLSE